MAIAANIEFACVCAAIVIVLIAIVAGFPLFGDAVTAVGEINDLLGITAPKGKCTKNKAAELHP